MKKLISALITTLVLLGITYALTLYTNAKFIDFSFIVGIVVSIIIWFFTSKGGFTSRNTDMIVQATTRIKQEEQKHQFTPNVVFLTSVAYTVISILCIVVYYREYF
ncbi:hypothetical protein J1P26_24360 [Neobacillus sp. MM2021_6]|uniref:hypothetical protein n=1 Tax=Bacillaceae TaxID=186817 RepID=UPI001409957D|nr:MULTISPECIES: hypothetical protein [Bacillaceae]MBO0962827.1 hypothetical protein [Neobacillus sp. MM2021_6]NHC21254.1 hypothetical protein [Bacillus sp. MM2020_4]